MAFLDEIETRNTPFEEYEDSYVVVNRLASKYGLTLQNQSFLTIRNKDSYY